MRKKKWKLKGFAFIIRDFPSDKLLYLFRFPSFVYDCLLHLLASYFPIVSEKLSEIVRFDKNRRIIETIINYNANIQMRWIPKKMKKKKKIYRMNMKYATKHKQTHATHTEIVIFSVFLCLSLSVENDWNGQRIVMPFDEWLTYVQTQATVSF